MSGDESASAPEVVLGAGEQTMLLLGALHELASAQIGFVLVGGLAVMARLGSVHRATTDLDALSGREDFALVCSQRVDGAVLDGDALYLRDVKVDTIVVEGDVGYDEIAHNVDEPIDRLFTAGHRFALDDAATMRVVSGDEAVETRVAAPRALLVTKLHAYLSPRRNPAKQGSDALDVVRLGELVASQHDRLVPGLVPDLVCEVAAWAFEQVLADQPKLTRRLRSIGSAAAPSELFELLLDDARSRAP